MAMLKIGWRMAGDDRKGPAVRSAWIVLGALPVAALTACAQAEPASEPGTDKVRTRGAQVTLPPPWTPTPTAVPTPTLTRLRAQTPSSSEPTSRSAADGFSGRGPWLLSCGQDERAVLTDLDGSGQLFPDLRCLRPGQVSGAAGFGMYYGTLVQLPGGEEIRDFASDTAAWSIDGALALVAGFGQNPGQDDLLLYRFATNRARPIHRSEFEITPLALSPAGTWAVFAEYDDLPNRSPFRNPPASLMAASSDGRRVVELYGVSRGRAVDDTLRGWVSETAFLISRTDPETRLAPPAIELLLFDLSSGSVRRIFGRHSQIAFDPSAQTILLGGVIPRARNVTDLVPGLVRLSAADDWTPHPVLLPEGWGDDWDVSTITWHPELGQFSTLIGKEDGLRSLHYIILDPDGSFERGFSLGDPTIVSRSGLFPSPDGELIVVGAPTPHGTRLYRRDGELVTELRVDGQGWNYGVMDIQWLPDAEAFFLIDLETDGLYRASAGEGWEPKAVARSTDATSELVLVQQPARPFRHVCDRPSEGRQQACERSCNARDYTRLHEGGRVVVSQEPPLSSRVRSSPQISGPVSGVLEPGDKADLLVGPVCGDGYVWWYVAPERGGAAGWVAEGDAEGAWLLPIEHAP